MIRNNTVDKEKIVRKLIYSYPDHVIDNDGVLDFDETVAGFARCIWRDFDTERQNYHFNTNFGSEEECERWLRNNLDNMYEDCQEFVDKMHTQIQEDQED